MNFKNTIAVLSNDISEVKRLIDSFSKKNSVSNIELDLTLEKLRKMYDILLLLRDDDEKTDEIVESIQEPEITEEKTQPKIVVEEPEITPEVEPPKIPQEITMEVENTVERVSLEEKTSQVSERPAVEEEKPRSSKLEVIGEKSREAKEFFNETFSQKHPVNDFTARQQTKPVSDLNKAIGINDKFLFINELFNGDSQLYKKAIEYINTCANFNEAFSYASDKLNWDMEDENVQKMLDLIRRKFISGKNV